MDIRIRKGFKLARIEAHRENRGKNGGHLALQKSAFAASAVDLYKHGDIEQAFYLLLCVIEVLSYFSHSPIIAAGARFNTKTDYFT